MILETEKHIIKILAKCINMEICFKRKLIEPICKIYKKDSQSKTKRAFSSEFYYNLTNCQINNIYTYTNKYDLISPRNEKYMSEKVLLR